MKNEANINLAAALRLKKRSGQFCLNHVLKTRFRILLGVICLVLSLVIVGFCFIVHKLIKLSLVFCHLIYTPMCKGIISNLIEICQCSKRQKIGLRHAYFAARAFALTVILSAEALTNSHCACL